MEPNAALVEQRRIIERMAKLLDAHVPQDPRDVARLVVLTAALDKWIAEGGALPRAWARPKAKPLPKVPRQKFKEGARVAISYSYGLLRGTVLRRRGYIPQVRHGWPAAGYWYDVKRDFDGSKARIPETRLKLLSTLTKDEKRKLEPKGD